MALFLDTSRGDSDATAFAIGDDVVRVASAHLLTRALEDRPEEMLVVIDADYDLASALAVSSEYRTRRPSLGVVLLRRRIDVSLMAQALQAGIREVVAADNLQAIAAACKRSREVSARQLGTTEAVGQGTIITVFSSKGGCGKTTISLNLAVALVAAEKRKTILVDLDLQFGDVGISLGLPSSPSIANAIPMAGQLDATGLQSLVHHHPSGLDCLLAPMTPEEVERIPGSLITEILRLLRSEYEYIVIDSPPAFTDTVLAALDLSDTYVLVTTPDIPALKNLRITLDTFDELGYPRSAWQVVLNRGDQMNGLEFEDIEAALGANVHLVIPQSFDVSRTGNRGVPIVDDLPKHPVSVAVRKLANMQRGLKGQQVGAIDTRKARGGGFFRRGK
jgi:pilus assembly protein CpaE